MGFGHTSGDRLDHRVTHHRAQARIVFELGLVSLQEHFVLVGGDVVPGVAGDQPTIGGFVFERVQVLGFAGQHADHFAALEQAAGIALAHKLGQVSAKQDVVDGIGLGIGQGLHHAARVEFAQRRRLLGHELDIGLCGFEQGLEGGDRRLAIFIVGVDHGPAFFLQLDGLGHQHGRLHIGAGAQTEGVGVAALPGELVGQGLAGQEKGFLLLGKVGHGQAGVGQEGAGEHIDFFARDQLFGHPHRIARVGVVVAGDEFILFTHETTGGIDLVNGQLHAFFVGLQKSGLRFVAVELTDLDGILGLRGHGGPSQGRERDGAA